MGQYTFGMNDYSDKGIQCKSKIHWIIFTSHINHNNEGGIIAYDMNYVKAFFSNKNQDLRKNIDLFYARMQPFIDNGKVKILFEENNMEVPMNFNFLQKLYCTMHNDIRKKDKSLLPIEMYLVYSARSFINYTHSNDDAISFQTFIQDLFNDMFMKEVD